VHAATVRRWCRDRLAGVSDAARIADRLDALAEAAELMGDEAGAWRLREQATAVRLEAMDQLDHRSPTLGS
jgi:hypothetical protein